jgi:hypothetical protein
MLAHEPRDEFGVGLAEAVAAAERFGVDRAEQRVVAPAALADVVVQAGDVEQLDLRHVAYAMRGDREVLFRRAVVQPAHVADDVHRVRVDRVDMEQVVLHLPDHLAEFRQIAAEHAIATHARQLRHQRERGLQEVDEQPGVRGIVAEGVVDQVQVFADRANRLGAHARDVAAVGHDHEHLEQCARRLAEHVRRHRLDVAVAQPEAIVDRYDARPFACPQDRFLEMLQEDVVDFGEFDDVPVVMVHEALDAEPGAGVGEAELLREGALVLELQVVFLASGEQVQSEPHPPQEAPAVLEPGVFLGREHAEPLPARRGPWCGTCAP